MPTVRNQNNKAKHKAPVKPPTITAYLKPTCGWSQGVRAVLQKYQLPYEDRDIINNPFYYAEMVRKSGQHLSPCVEINGHMLADVSGEEAGAYLLKAGLVEPATAAPTPVPTDRGCADHH